MAAGKNTIVKSLFSASGLILILAALVLANLIFSRVNLRWDLTEDNLYSLSEGTEQILSDMENDVTLRLFVTRDNVNVPITIRSYTDRLVDFLSEYEYAGNGKVTLEVIDTRIDSEEEDWARRYGLEGVDLPSGERIYLGLIAESADQERAIPMLDPSAEAQLEYDVTRIISMVQSPKKQKIAVVSGLPVFGGARTSFDPGGSEPWFFIQELKKAYEVEEVSPLAPGAEIPGDAELVMLIHPRGINDRLLYEVDQYLVGGGNLLILVDPYAVMDMSQGFDKGSSLDRLFAAWGIRMDKTKALVDLAYATRLRAQDNRIENNPLWLSLRAEAFDKETLITAGLESMLLPVAGVIERLEEKDPGLSYQPLLRSSLQSGLIDSFKTQFSVADIRKDFSAADVRYDLAVQLHGRFPSAFRKGPPEPEGADQEQKTGGVEADAAVHHTEAEEASTVIVLADADFLYDGYYLNRQNFLGFEMASIFNDNLNFLLNSGELLAGVDALIRIRSRGAYERPFDRVAELEARAQEKWLEREKELERKVEELNAKLNALEKQKDAAQKLILSPEQEAEVERFQEERQRISEELKEVRRNLRGDIESLGRRVKFINIFLVPLLVCIAGGFYALYRRKRSRER